MNQMVQRGAAGQQRAKPDNLEPTHKKVTAAIEKLERIVKSRKELEAKIADGSAVTSEHVGSLQVQIHKARFLPEESSCFIRVSLPDCKGENEFKTAAAAPSEDGSASWDQTFSFDAVLKLDAEATVSIIQEKEDGEECLAEFKVDLTPTSEHWASGKEEGEAAEAAKAAAAAAETLPAPAAESGFEEVDSDEEAEAGAEAEGEGDGEADKPAAEKGEVDVQITTEFTAAPEDPEPRFTVLKMREEKALVDLQVLLAAGKKLMEERDVVKVEVAKKKAKDATLVGATVKKYNQIMTPETKSLMFNLGMFVGGIGVMHNFGDVLAV